MSLLRAEALALLLVRDTGRLVAAGREVDLVLAGALLSELEAEGHLDRRPRTERDDADRVIGRRHRVRWLGAEPPGDPLLAEAYGLVGERRAGAAVRAVARDARSRVYARLAERELVSVRPRRLTTRYAVLDVTARDTVRRRFGAVLVDGFDPDPPTVSEIWLFDACASLRHALPGADRATIRRNRSRLPRRGWVEQRVADEINAARSAGAS